MPAAPIPRSGFRVHQGVLGEGLGFIRVTLSEGSGFIRGILCDVSGFTSRQTLSDGSGFIRGDLGCGFRFHQGDLACMRVQVS